MQLSRKQIQHLHLRAGFGISPHRVHESEGLEARDLVNQLFVHSTINQPLDIIQYPLDNTQQGVMALPDSMRKTIKQDLKEQVKDLNLAWIHRMSDTEAILREKMTLFWHDHFACRVPNAWVQQRMNNLMRSHALGNFGELVSAVSREPAMLQFLNNQQNRKKHPNENFARELMELFTLGLGNYTEEDIKESARAFTGWGYDQRMEFQFRKGIHDDGIKTFMGQSGNFDGHDIIRAILQQKQCARFVTNKIYQFLVGENPGAKRLNTLSNQFYTSDYDIGNLIKTILTAEWFYSEEVVGNKIKDPTQLIVGFMRSFDVEFTDPKSLIFLQRILGQVLFYPPNVAGWPEGKQWIDSSTMVFRMKFPEYLFKQAEIDTVLEANPDGLPYKLSSRKLDVVVKPDSFIQFFTSTDRAEVLKEMSDHLLQHTLSAEMMDFLLDQVDAGEDLTTQKMAFAMLLAKLPDYQLC